MTSTIYQKLRPKRKYHKTPPCGHTDGYCDMEQCRQKYAIKTPKIVKKIDEYLHHREKVIKRRREILLNKLDAENNEDYGLRSDWSSYPIKGEYAKHKAQIKKYKRMFWRCLFIFMGIVLLASLIM